MRRIITDAQQRELLERFAAHDSWSLGARDICSANEVRAHIDCYNQTAAYTAIAHDQRAYTATVIAEADGIGAPDGGPARIERHWRGRFLNHFDDDTVPVFCADAVIRDMRQLETDSATVRPAFTQRRVDVRLARAFGQAARIDDTPSPTPPTNDAPLAVYPGDDDHRMWVRWRIRANLYVHDGEA